MFNWYFSKDCGGNVCITGDACVIEMRHDEYRKEKLRYASYKTISKNDKKWMSTQVGSFKIREFEYIHACPVAKMCDGTVVCTCKDVSFRLVAMDSYFERVPEKKLKQLEFMALISV